MWDHLPCQSVLIRYFSISLLLCHYYLLFPIYLVLLLFDASSHSTSCCLPTSSSLFLSCLFFSASSSFVWLLLYVCLSHVPSAPFLPPSSYSLQCCVFSSRLMGRGSYVFDRRWDRMRLALQNMVEKHLNAQMWRWACMNLLWVNCYYFFLKWE